MSQLACILVMSFLLIHWENQLVIKAQTIDKNSLKIEGTVAVSVPYLKGYEYFSGVGYYKFHPEGAYSFHDAMLSCRKEGGHLAIPNSQREMNVLNQIYGRYPQIYHYAYVGFHDMYEEDKHSTIFGQRLQDAGFSNWEKGEPNQGHGNEDCGTIKKNGNLNDLRCKLDYLVPYFCEYDTRSLKIPPFPMHLRL